MNTYQVNGATKYWATKAGATRMMNKLADEAENTNDFTCWVQAWEYGKGWFLEDLDKVGA